MSRNRNLEKHEIKTLLEARFAMALGAGLAGVFIAILIYEVGGGLEHVGLFYAAIYALYFLLLPFFIRIALKFGFRNSLSLSVVFGLGYFLSCGLIEFNGWFAVSAILFISLFKLFFWAPFNIDFISSLGRGSENVGSSTLSVVKSLAAVLAGVTAGLIIESIGYWAVFAIALMLYSTSLFFYRRVTRHGDVAAYEFTPRQLFRATSEALSTNRGLGFFSYGIERSISLYIWPVIIFMLLNGDYVAVGAVSSLITFVVILIQLFLLKADSRSDGIIKTFAVSTKLNGLVWFSKIFVLTAYQIFFVGVIQRLNEAFLLNLQVSQTYALALDHEHRMEEFVAVREMIMALGRVSAMVVVIVAALLNYLWVILMFAAAGAVMTSKLIKRGDSEDLSQSFI